MPVLATWDDHDYGQNDGGADFPYKEAAKELFLEFWGLPEDDPRRTREGIYHAADVRPRRHARAGHPARHPDLPLAAAPRRRAGARWQGPYLPDPDPTKTMLGAAQWTWLRSSCEQPAELRLIVSSVQVLAEGHNFERWGNLPRGARAAARADRRDRRRAA